MTPNADIIANLLIALSLGTESGNWRVYVSFLPDLAHDNVIGVYDTSGKLNGRLMSSGEQIEHPGVQIRLRGSDYAATVLKARTVAQIMDAQHNTQVEVNGETYTLQNFSRSGSILPMGMEQEGDRRRYNFTINAILTVSQNQ